MARLVILASRSAPFRKGASEVEALGIRYEQLTESQIRDHCHALRETFRRGRESSSELTDALAALREFVFRRSGLRAHPVQIGAALGLWSGVTVELATGEGKTLTAIIAATLRGWRGKGCHVITVNDYLAKRDAEYASTILEPLGLVVGCASGDASPSSRRTAYAADITYVTNKTVAADFLRDRLTEKASTLAVRSAMSEAFGFSRESSRPLLRGLESAIVDEADSVMIDQADTPLIISGEVPDKGETRVFREADAIARDCEETEHYQFYENPREIRLTDEGREHVARAVRDLGHMWQSERRNEEVVRRALQARHMFERDKHYIIENDKVVIVDESTGRVMPDRSWRDGLHGAIEAKEGLPISPEKQTLARISFQRFFQMYRSLAAMTGTAREARAEIWQTYRMRTVRFPTHRPCVRVEMPDTLMESKDRKWQAVLEEIQSMRAAGRPVLVGTRTVAASAEISQVLQEAGVEHRVLNARNEAEEASIVAEAGRSKRITIATNLAGRGTDITLDEPARSAGGLHVIMTERHLSPRVDRQLCGRAGRQGDPGSSRAIMSLDDELFESSSITALLSTGDGEPSRLQRTLRTIAIKFAQAAAEQRAVARRKSVESQDDWLEHALAFAGQA